MSTSTDRSKGKRRATPAIAAVLVLICAGASGCQVQRTVLSERPGKIQIAGQEDDTDKIRSKFAETGYEIGEDGSIKANNSDMFGGQAIRGSREFRGKKQVRLDNRETRKKMFETPEYLERGAFNQSKKRAGESGILSRQGNDRAREGGQGFVNREDTGILQRVNPFATKQSRAGSQKMAWSRNQRIQDSITNAPTAEGTRQAKGYLDKADMTVGDVKKLLNPNAYATSKGL